MYADFGGWHLYLRDMKGTGELKMSQVLAAAIGPMVSPFFLSALPAAARSAALPACWMGLVATDKPCCPCC